MKEVMQQALEQPCHIWQRSLAQGYGVIYNYNKTGKRKRAHVAIWEAANGPVPKGFVLDHVCRKRSCVNPSHLELVTSAENTLRGNGPTAINARKTHCNHGHELSGDNLLIDYRGRRRCKTCQREHEKKSRRKV